MQKHPEPRPASAAGRLSGSDPFLQGQETEILHQHKAELLDWFSRPPCPGWQAVPPADLPLNPVPPRPSAPRREAAIAYLLRQTSDRPRPLAAWLVLRENAYYEGPGRHWDCALHAYAAARDAACCQLSRTESEVWQFLDASEASLMHGRVNQSPTENL